MNASTLYHLKFKWSVSRGRDTYGYHICTLYVDGIRVASCNGGGYDMEGTVFGEWLEKAFQSELRAIARNAKREAPGLPGGKLLPKGELYGMRAFYDADENLEEVRLDGGFGFSSMEKIAQVIGITLRANVDHKNRVESYTAILDTPTRRTP